MPARDDEVQTLVEQLSAQLDRSVLVDDASLRLLAYSPTLGSEDEVRRTAILTRETPRVIRDLHFSQGIANATHPVRTAPRPDIGLESRVCVPIRCQGALFGYLWLIDADQSLTDADCDAAEQTAAEIGTAMYRRDELERPQREHELKLLEMLLGPDPGEREAAAHELTAQELIQPHAGIAVLAMRPWRGGDHDVELPASERARLGLALDQFRRALPRRQSLSVVHGEHGVMVVALDGRHGTLAEIAARAQDALDQAFADGPVRIALGYSGQHEHLRDAYRAHEHARLSLRVAGALPEHGTPAGWDDLGAYRLLARAAETPHARELIHPGLPQLFALQSKESLVQTLEAYLDNGCDTKLTAEALFLHRASLYYRLQRIEAITETSLKSGADRLALHSGLKLARLVGTHPALRRTNAD
ncbi:helix-turn-helix domain-containing protein [Solirubrobacter sp. CPCC 204708]|uniref:Helix-turn-helix domain-containing protein n=1 Tax=Solirubrobacter deserti TaxID=2282478 RepID=A0ABT4RBW5_9ACTN|nr:helix-turn-helix domain-containing protein [Solirubrobacter deserti]MBE2317089.1 helix-turn-helix domain-containing protein [Solirubrobacter deserti]MDA0136019.1 helix-turn-helix domain-containing protein [Solirubrobacter deserti]